ncbi:hypothetical protein [Antribacter gilvus]|uniref:hypothetical protein n=1 Tax=Antribacter gilvus TaxID=2304675 RepID=UPI000F768F49|nr:hypothetical protein [Antribacter gilvus]
MSETQENPTPAPADGKDDVELRSVIDPGSVRRAPRYKAFFWTGALAGLLIGVGLSLYLVGTDAAEGMMKPGVYVTVLTLFVTMVTTLVAGLVAVVVDKRSLRRR